MLDKLKTFWIEYKIYIIIASVAVAGYFIFKKK
jgi:hypothetical protein